MSAKLSPLFSWRSAICDSDLPPTARHVALTLSLHMSERGDSCYPSIATQCAETGLGKTAVCRNLRALEESGWIERAKGTKGRSTRYTAKVGGSALGEHPSMPKEQSSASGEHEVVKESDKKDDKDQALSTATPSKEERDNVWNALEEIFAAPTTPQGRARFGKLRKELLADSSLTPGEVVEEIPVRARRYREKWPEAYLTLEAFAKHWPDLSRDAPPRESRNAAILRRSREKWQREEQARAEGAPA